MTGRCSRIGFSSTFASERVWPQEATKKGTCQQQGSTKMGSSTHFHRLTLAASVDCFKGFYYSIISTSI